MCRPLQPCYHRKKIGGRGLGVAEDIVTEHTRGRAAVYSVLTVMPRWALSPQHIIGNVSSYTKKGKLRF